MLYVVIVVEVFDSEQGFSISLDYGYVSSLSLRAFGIRTFAAAIRLILLLQSNAHGSNGHSIHLFIIIVRWK